MNNLEMADSIIKEYSQPGSMIDEGNLFFAATQYQEAYQALKKEVGQLLKQRNEAFEECDWPLTEEEINHWKGFGLNTEASEIA